MNIHVIAQIHLPEPGGVFAAGLARHWAAQGHRLTVWTAAESVSEVGIEVVRISKAYDRTSLVGRASRQLGFVARAALDFNGQFAGLRSPPSSLSSVALPFLPSFLRLPGDIPRSV